jgi:excinuclease ABC A subunit
MNETVTTSIDIVGADANNLKNIDVHFPLKQISVLTGVSGSGKSSLLSDTLAAEGSRRMQFFLGTSQHELERDEVRAFVGPLPPTILVGQRGFRPTVRTTAGTATGFLSVLRRLFVLASIPFSDRVQEAVPPPSPDTYARWLLRHYRGPAEIWSAPVRGQRTDCVSAVEHLASCGIEQIIIRSETDPSRLRESGRKVTASQFRGVSANIAHTVEALVGQVEIGPSSDMNGFRMLLERAFSAGNGSVVITLPTAIDPALRGQFGFQIDSAKHWVHPDSPEIFAPPSVHLLTFNSPEHESSGACPSCAGTGIGRRLREGVLIKNPDRSMRDGALAIWTTKNYKYVNIQHETIEGLRGMYGFSPDVPWSKLPPSARALVLEGARDELVTDRDRSGRKLGPPRPFAGFRRIILDKASTGTKIAAQLAPYVEAESCEACDGTRWSFQARALRVCGYGIAGILSMTFTEVETLTEPSGAFNHAASPDMRPLVEAIRRHAHSIGAMGLGYLTGDRGMLDVSEGESRRIRLARVLDAGESGLCLLLDEPARGLHESDLAQLADSLLQLRGKHTVILNEHRERLWDIADWFVEVGPAAGTAGGEITYAGPRQKAPNRHEIAPLRASRARSSTKPKVTIKGASIHNVLNVDCEIPIGALTCISGVSGSGKSSFVRGVLVPALLESVGGTPPDYLRQQGRWRSISGTRAISEIVALDQIMPPPNRRSLVATFTGLMDDIRKTFGASPAARRGGLSASDFGVNAGSGRCQVCAGIGEVVSGDIWSVCPTCGGSRYGQEVLSIRIGGVNVQELLLIPIERLGSFASTFNISERLIASVSDLGIGDIALGRRIDSLSGGEVQRLRLAMRLSAESTGSIFFVLDEPAAGLHPRDVQRLASELERVLDGNRNTVVIVEHNPRLIQSADWVVEFGPGSGPNGGKIVFAGSPTQLAKVNTPTGLALAGKLTALKRPPKAAKPPRTNERLGLKQQLERTNSLIRTLITGDAPAVLDLDQGLAEPMVVISERFWLGYEFWEVAGLDREIPKLLLDVQRMAKERVLADLLSAWKKDPGCWLAIQPFMTDMQIWGTGIPESVRRAISSHIEKERLQLVTTMGEALHKKLDPRHIRAAGPRFVPDDDSEGAHDRVLRDAFAIGARYVELRARNGRLCATASDRLVNLETGVIAPMIAVPSHFSRFESLGRCPMCEGSRLVTALSETLVIGNRAAEPDSDQFLTAEATAVMKGILRNELRPFLRRLSKECLWDPKTPFERLDHSKRNLILYGFWARPGPGSFLKSSKADSSEVASWLRWDGLYRHVTRELGRSRSAEWAQRVRESAHTVRCLLCEGSGLRRFAELLMVGKTPLSDWIRLHRADRMIDSLRRIQTDTLRQQKTLNRILDCLGTLGVPAFSGTPASIVERSVASFTTMQSVQASRVDQR